MAQCQGSTAQGLYADSSLSFRGKVLYSPDIPATRKIIEIANKIMEFPAYMKKLVDLLNKQKGFLRQFAQDTESIQMIKVRSQDRYVSSLSNLGHKANSKSVHRYLANFFPRKYSLPAWIQSTEPHSSKP